MAMIPMEYGGGTLSVNYKTTAATTIAAYGGATIAIYPDTNTDLTNYTMMGMTYMIASGDVHLAMRGYSPTKTGGYIYVSNPQNATVTMAKDTQVLTAVFMKND